MTVIKLDWWSNPSVVMWCKNGAHLSLVWLLCLDTASTRPLTPDKGSSTIICGVSMKHQPLWTPTWSLLSWMTTVFRELSWLGCCWKIKAKVALNIICSMTSHLRMNRTNFQQSEHHCKKNKKSYIKMANQRATCSQNNWQLIFECLTQFASGRRRPSTGNSNNNKKEKKTWNNHFQGQTARCHASFIRDIGIFLLTRSQLWLAPWPTQRQTL